MPRKLILIRHSLSEMEPEVPVARWRLSPEGVARARDFAARVDPGTADRVFTSPEPKAAQTAGLLGAAWNLAVEEIAALHEHERPEARILPRDQFDDLVRAVFARRSEIVFGAESADQALERFGSTVMRLAGQTSRDVVAVTHGTVIALFVAKHTGTDPFEFWRRQQMPFAVTLTLPELRLEKLTFLTSHP